MQTTSETLRAAKALIDTPEKWTQGAYARDEEGLTVFVGDEAAVCFCSIGALARTERLHNVPDPHELGRRATIRALRPSHDPILAAGLIADFNDTHSHSEVMAMWDRAIKRAAEEELQ